MPADRVHVIGAGVMGTGIAHDLAQNGHPVVLIDQNEAILSASRERIHELCRMERFLANPNAGDPEETLGRIETTTEAAALGDAVWLIEAVTEDWGVKQDVYREADRRCPPECIFISNTSAMPITQLAAFTGRPDRVVGVHFMNPVARIHAVEVIPGEQTSAETVERTLALLAGLGKAGIPIKDSPGFVSNRLLMGMINEAVRLVEEGVAGPQTIDRVCRECFGHKMGPLETADLIGLDTIAQTLAILETQVSAERYKPCAPLSERVAEGRLGRKSGEGFCPCGG